MSSDGSGCGSDGSVASSSNLLLFSRLLQFFRTSSASQWHPFQVLQPDRETVPNLDWCHRTAQTVCLHCSRFIFPSKH